MDATAGEISARKVRFHQGGTKEVRPAEVRPAEVRPAEVRPLEVWTDVGVLITPRIPGVRPLLEHRDVLVVRHGSTPEVLRRTICGRW